MPPQKKIIKNVPKTEGEILDSKIVPYVEEFGKPSIHQYKRGNDTTLRGEEIKNISVGLQDIDYAVLYYFDEVIKPYVINESTKYNVPVFFADPERWKSAQKDGQYRDKEGRILFPVITLRRDNMEKNRSLTNKLDGNVANVYSMYEKKYTSKNQYDNFSVLTNRAPVKEFYNVVMPDYYTITYSCAVFVSFIEDMNKIIEAIGYRSDSYWGEPGKFLFKSKIDSFPITNQVNEGEDRRIVSTFTITLNGYLTPDNIDRFLATEKFKYRNKTQILFTLEASSQDMNRVTFQQQPFSKVAKTSYIPEGVTVNNIVNQFLIQLDTATIEYLNTSIAKQADIITANTATFSSTSFRQPTPESGLPATSVTDFKIFINGVYLEPLNIVSFVQSGINVVLTVNPTTLGYSLDSIDVVIAIGKFN
jgi:hypothetical protein